MTRVILKTIICAGVLTALLNAGPATADVITIDFEDQPVAVFVPENLVIKGFQFSPRFYYHVLPATFDPEGTNYPSQWLGWNGGCGPCDQPPNQNYTGLPADGAAMWVNYFGKPFSFLSVIPLKAFGEAEWTVTSSNGGSFRPSFLDNRTVVEFSGPQWADVTWLMFDVDVQGGSDGFDNITFRVPEPDTALLVAGVLSFLAITRRRRRTL